MHTDDPNTKHPTRQGIEPGLYSSVSFSLQKEGRCDVKGVTVYIMRAVVILDRDVYSPSGSNLDLKKSSYKKLSQFLAAMQQRGFVQVKELSKGVESIVTIHQDHSELV